MCIRTLSRRRLAGTLVALALLGGTLVPEVMRAMPTEAPSPQYRRYYWDSSLTQLVGTGTWTCEHTYVQHTGYATAYFKYTLLDCSGGGDPVER